MPTIGPLVAYPLTPRGEDGRLLTSSFEQLVDTAISAGANAVGVLGSTGGFAYMPRSARKRITRSAVEVADGRAPVIVGVGALSTAEVLANLAEAHSVGASGALLQPMAYQPLTFDEIYGLYKDASAATEIPLWVYNNPSTTGHRFSVEQLTKIGRLSAVAGFKDRAANATDAKDRMERIAAAMPPRTARQIDWGFSGDGHGAQVLLAGATAWHSGLAGVLPEICVAIAQAATSGHAPHARVLQRQLTPLSIIVRQYGGIRTAHSIAQMLGLDAGHLPRPLAPLPAEARTLVRMALDGISVPDAPTPDEAAARQAESDADAAAEKIVVETRAAAQRAQASGTSARRAASGTAAAEPSPAESDDTTGDHAPEAHDPDTSAPDDITPDGSTPPSELDDAPSAAPTPGVAGTGPETTASASAVAPAPAPAPAAAPASADDAAPADGAASRGERPAPAEVAAVEPDVETDDQPDAATAEPEISRPQPEHGSGERVPGASAEQDVAPAAAPVARRAAPARTRTAARAASAVPPGASGASGAQDDGTAADAPTDEPAVQPQAAAQAQAQAQAPAQAPASSQTTPGSTVEPAPAARRPEPTKTGAVAVAPEPGQQARPAPVRSDGGAGVPAPVSLGRSRTEQPRRVRTPPTPVTDDDVVVPDEETSTRSGRHSG